MLPKQSISFPEVAVIRKGSPKRKNPKNPSSWMQGQDLGRFFRVAFAPGTDEIQKVWKELHPESVKVYGDQYAEPNGFEIARLRCMLTTRNVLDAWEWANEAYNSGRLIARADDEHFITLRNPVNGEYEVVNGEPFKPYTVGQDITYERDGKKYTLPVRAHGRLSLFLPDLGRMVRFTLKTTSYYDRLNISANLAAIQFLADTLNSGNAAGIPFWIYRKEQEVTWNKPDGGAQRVKKWLVVVEADSEWVKNVTARMANFALGNVLQSQVLLPAPAAGPVNPNDAEDEAPENEPGDYIDGDYQDNTPPEPEPAPETKQEVKQEAKADAPPKKIERPYQPDELLIGIDKMVTGQYANVKASDKQRQLLAMLLDQALVDIDKYARYKVTKWLTGKAHVSELSDAQVNALIKWLNPQKAEKGYLPGQYVEQEAKAVYARALLDEGQLFLFGGE